jgi:prepilin-type N-terminal cleavage/methylation domain-containing protein
MKLMRLRPSRARQAFTLIEILIVVAIMGIILGIALPAFLKSRLQARKQVCIGNISQIESAKQQYGLENNKKDGDAVVEANLFGSDLYIKVKPECPGGGVYTLQAIGTVATCSLGVAEGHSL